MITSWPGIAIRRRLWSLDCVTPRRAANFTHSLSLPSCASHRWPILICANLKSLVDACTSFIISSRIVTLANNTLGRHDCGSIRRKQRYSYAFFVDETCVKRLKFLPIECIVLLTSFTSNFLPPNVSSYLLSSPLQHGQVGTVMSARAFGYPHRPLWVVVVPPASSFNEETMTSSNLGVWWKMYCSLCSIISHALAAFHLRPSDTPTLMSFIRALEASELWWRCRSIVKDEHIVLMTLIERREDWQVITPDYEKQAIISGSLGYKFLWLSYRCFIFTVTSFWRGTLGLMHRGFGPLVLHRWRDPSCKLSKFR
jgi:hypothetical protein